MLINVMFPKIKDDIKRFKVFYIKEKTTRLLHDLYVSTINGVYVKERLNIVILLNCYTGEKRCLH